MDKFHESSRVATRFCNPFQVAYDSLVGNPQGAEGNPGAGDGVGKDEEKKATAAASAKPDKEEKETPKKTTDTVEVDSFRSECELHVQREIEARSVCLLAGGSPQVINQDITSSCLYQNLTASVSCMGFYDVKNARLTDIFEGEGFLFTPRVP